MLVLTRLMSGRSPHRAALPLLALVAVCLASACTEKQPESGAPPGFDPNDRTLEKLRAEVDRANRGEGVARAPDAVEDPNERLAGIAVQDGKARTLKLPEHNPPVKLGGLTAQVFALSASHSVRAGKLQLTSEDAFVEARLGVQNTSSTPARLDLSLARIVDQTDHTFPIASDAQRGAGTRQLQLELAPNQREEFTLYFEVPPSVIGHGLRLVLPAAVAPGATEDVSLPLD